MELENNDGSDDLHVKMCRKIAQLVKVIHALNIKNSDQTKLISHLGDKQNGLLSEKMNELAKMEEELKKEKENNSQLLKKIQTTDVIFKTKLNQTLQKHSNATAAYEKELNLMRSSLTRIKQNLKEKNDEIESLKIDTLQNADSVQDIKISFEAELEKSKVNHNNEIKCLMAVCDEKLTTFKDQHSESEKHVRELLEKVAHLEKQLVVVRREYEANLRESRLKYEELSREMLKDRSQYQCTDNEKAHQLVELEKKLNESQFLFKQENEVLSSELSKNIEELKNCEKQLLQKDSIIKSQKEKLAQQENTIEIQKKQITQNAECATGINDKLGIEDLERFSYIIGPKTPMEQDLNIKLDHTSEQHTEDIEKLLLESRQIIREILARVSSLKAKTSDPKSL